MDDRVDLDVGVSGRYTDFEHRSSEPKECTLIAKCLQPQMICRNGRSAPLDRQDYFPRYPVRLYRVQNKGVPQ